MRKITTKKTRQGIEITLPHSEIAILDNHHTLSFVIIWGVMGPFSLNALIGYLMSSTFWPLSKNITISMFLGVWGLPLLGLLFLFIGKHIFGIRLDVTNIICTSPQSIMVKTTLCGVCMAKKLYLRNHIHNLHLTHPAPSADRKIAFDYTHQPRKFQSIWRSRKREAEMIEFGRGLRIDDAKDLAKYLTDVLTFRCDVVTQIIFGMSRSSGDKTSVALYDPDVSELMTPFVRLTSLLIDTETYNFHHVERFLTYAINYLGQDYLRNHVDVHLYGETKKLHVNLYNNLRNLCTNVIVHPKV